MKICDLNLVCIIFVFNIIFNSKYCICKDVKELTRFTQRSENIAISKQTIQTSNHHSSSLSSLAVDGSLSTCSKTALEKNSNWTVDLGKVFVVAAVVIEYKDATFFGLNHEVYTGTTLNDLLVCNYGSGDLKPLHLLTCLSGPQLARYVRIKNMYGGGLELCEVKVMVCKDGYFNDSCSMECGCQGGDVCHKGSGRCPGLCREGVTGQHCQKECPPNTFGPSCIHHCHCHPTNSTCDPLSGVCQQGCQQGWMGGSCQTALPHLHHPPLLLQASPHTITITWKSWSGYVEEGFELLYEVQYKSGDDDDGGGDGDTSYGGDGGARDEGGGGGLKGDEEEYKKEEVNDINIKNDGDIIKKVDDDMLKSQGEMKNVKYDQTRINLHDNMYDKETIDLIYNQKDDDDDEDDDDDDDDERVKDIGNIKRKRSVELVGRSDDGKKSVLEEGEEEEERKGEDKRYKSDKKNEIGDDVIITTKPTSSSGLLGDWRVDVVVRSSGGEEEKATIQNLRRDASYQFRVIPILHTTLSSHQHRGSSSPPSVLMYTKVPVRALSILTSSNKNNTLKSKNNNIIIITLTCVVSLVCLLILLLIIVYRRHILRYKSLSQHDNDVLKSDVMIGELEVVGGGVKENRDVRDEFNNSIVTSFQPPYLNTRIHTIAEGKSRLKEIPMPEIPTNCQPIRVEDLEAWVEKGRLVDCFLFKKEYKEIGNNTDDFEMTQGNLSHNKHKNRFINILPYDHTRVKLEGTSSDYINANYIPGYKKSKAYIAAQGCNKYSVEDMWRMVMQESVSRIVMVTNLVEKGRVKCEEYWSEEVGKEVVYADVVVVLRQMEKNIDYTIRTFEIRKLLSGGGNGGDGGEESGGYEGVYRGNGVDNAGLNYQNGGVYGGLKCQQRGGGEMKGGLVYGEVRHVKQFHFTAWPDHGVPDKVWPIISFRRRVRQYDESHPGVIVVHCSAGVGRTGAFIAVDSLLDQADDTHCVDLFRCTSLMRRARMNMIQTLDQYLFVYDVLLEALTLKNTCIPSSCFEQVFLNLLSGGDEDGDGGGGCSGGGARIRGMKKMTKLEKEFQLLEQWSGKEREVVCEAGVLPENVHKNRFSSVLPDERHRACLNTAVAGTNDYINAVYLDGYRSKGAYIATQMPMPHTVIDLWRLVHEVKAGSIIMLNPWDEEDETYGQYWPEENEECECGPFIIEATSISHHPPPSLHYSSPTNNHPPPTKNHSLPTNHHFQNLEGPITIRELKLTYTPTDTNTGPGVTGGEGVCVGEGVSGEEVSGGESCGESNGTRDVGQVKSDTLADAAVLSNSKSNYNASNHISNNKANNNANINNANNNPNINNNSFNNSKNNSNSSNNSNNNNNSNNTNNSNKCNLEDNYNLDSFLIPTTEEVSCHDKSLIIENKHPHSHSDLRESVKSQHVVNHFQLNIPWPSFLNNKKNNNNKKKKECDNVDNNTTDHGKGVGSRKGIYACSFNNNNNQNHNKLINQTNAYINIRNSNSDKDDDEGEEGDDDDDDEGEEGEYYKRFQGVLLGLLEVVEKSQMKTGNRPIIVHCRDGLSESGMLVGVTCVLDGLKDAGGVEVFQAVRRLRQHRPGAVINCAQYKCCYDMAQAYLRGFSIYSNFK